MDLSIKSLRFRVWRWSHCCTLSEPATVGLKWLWFLQAKSCSVFFLDNTATFCLCFITQLAKIKLIVHVEVVCRLDDEVDMSHIHFLFFCCCLQVHSHSHMMWRQARLVVILTKTHFTIPSVFLLAGSWELHTNRKLVLQFVLLAFTDQGNNSWPPWGL